MIPLTWKLDYLTQILEIERTVVSQSREQEETDTSCLMCTEFQFREMKRILEIKYTRMQMYLTLFNLH